MTDAELVAKKLALIETYVRELRTLARPEAIEGDLRERRFAEHTIQIAVQACQDVASHIVSDERLGEPRTNQQLFELLRDAGWLSAELAARLRQAVGLRNVARPRVLRGRSRHREGRRRESSRRSPGFRRGHLPPDRIVGDG